MPGTRKLKLLVVEDDPAMVRSIQRVLTRHGHSVSVMNSASSALEQLAERFDAAVLDIDLPDGNGVQLAESLLTAQTTSAVAFFSGTSDPKLLLRAASLGPVVSKSAGFGALERAVLKATAQAARKAVGAEGQPEEDCLSRDTGARLRVPGSPRFKVPKD